MSSSRLAIDIGGTFTDVVLETASGQRFTTKVLTTPAAPEEGFLRGTELVLEQAKMTLAEIDLIIHGTTLATNALIERKGAKVALLTTQGFRDSVEMAYEHRFDQSDLFMERPAPLVPRTLRLEVPERCAADGSVLLPLDEAAVEALLPTLADEGIQALAICFLHSYLQGDHERRTAEIVRRRFPDMAISLSCEVSPEIREYDRLSTTIANAYVQPLMDGYLERLGTRLKSQGFPGQLLMMMSSGGMTTIEAARAFPIRLVESGPAGGAIFARHIAAQMGLSSVLSFDMGGTTAKICLIDDMQPQLSRSFEVARVYRFLKGSGFPLRIPVIDMVEIGAGGGSIATVDALGRIAVGPESAGSTPGPACYGRGGTEPTVTDADLVIGRIDPTFFGSGRVPLDRDAARKALNHGLGKALELTDAEAACGISEIVDENMANAARVHAVENGKELEDRTLIAFGGAAPLHAARLAGKLGIARVVIPAGAGVGSAIGFLRAGISYEVLRTRYVSLDGFDPAIVNALYQQMHDEAEAVVRRGHPEGALDEVRTCFMRYRGQGHEVSVQLPNRPLTAADREFLINSFYDAYRTVFGRTIPKLGVEVVNWGLALSAPYALPERQPDTARGIAATPRGTRMMFDPANLVEAATSEYLRPDLAPGAFFAGPAVIAEAETSTIVPADFEATITATGTIVMERRSTR